jgi:hypothetical protein
VLKVPDPVECDPLQGKYVMSPGLKQALLKLQTGQRGLPTGQLDYNTLRWLSGGDIGPYLSNIDKAEATPR